jgi:hypothetical protein
MSPYKSDAQRRKFHAMLDRGEISAATVHEFDEASKGMNLPARAAAKRVYSVKHSGNAAAKSQAHAMSKSKRGVRIRRKKKGAV